MESIRKIVLDIIIIGACIFTAIYVYQVYGESIRNFFFEESSNVVIFIENLAVSVSVADSQAERTQGLSGVKSLDDLEGKLFIFDQEGIHSIWMKDMHFPIDIIYIDENFRVVDIHENVTPDSYPKTFSPSAPVRFILETNAFFVKSFNVQIGQYITIPGRIIPSDLRENL